MFAGNSAAGLGTVAVGHCEPADRRDPAVLLPAALPGLQQLPACPAGGRDLAPAARGDPEPQAHRLPRRAARRQPRCRHAVRQRGDRGRPRERRPHARRTGARPARPGPAAPPASSSVDITSAPPEIAGRARRPSGCTPSSWPRWRASAGGSASWSSASAGRSSSSAASAACSRRSPTRPRSRCSTPGSSRSSPPSAAGSTPSSSTPPTASCWSTAPDGCCSWNPAMTLMTGRSQAVALGMPLGDALERQHRERASPRRCPAHRRRPRGRAGAPAGHADHDRRPHPRGGPRRLARTRRRGQRAARRGRGPRRHRAA